MAEFYMRDIKDWKEATLMLSFEEKGYFDEILSLIYLYDGCLPDDDLLICKAMPCNRRQHNRLKKALLKSELITIKDGLYFNYRASKELLKINSISTKNKLKADKRWSKSLKENKTGDAVAMLKVKVKSEVKDLSKDKYKTPEVITPDKHGLEIKFNEFWKEYPRRLGGNPKSNAKTKFISICKAINPDEIISGAKKYALQEAENTDRKFIAQAITWLNQSRWEDDYILPTKQHLESALDFGVEETEEVVATHYDQKQIMEMLGNG